AVQRGLDRILRMHEAWLTGDMRLPLPPQPILPDEVRIEGWGLLFVGLLVELLEFDEQVYIQSALRGLYRLLCQMPQLADAAIAAVERAGPEVERRFLLISESLAILPEASTLEHWLGTKLVSPALDIALSAWVAL